MKIRSLSIATLIALTALGTAGFASADAKADINKVYASIQTSMKTNNSKLVDQLLNRFATSDFSAVDMSKKSMNKTQFSAMVKQQMAATKNVKTAIVKVTKITVTGKSAKAWVTMEMAGTIVGPDKKNHQITDVNTSVDDWVLDGKVWKMKTTKTLTDKGTMDGKPMTGGM